MHLVMTKDQLAPEHQPRPRMADSLSALQLKILEKNLQLFL